MNGYLEKLERLGVWMSSIDWCLNWPYWTFISWDVIQLRNVNMEGFSRKKEFWFSKTYFLAFFVTWHMKINWTKHGSILYGPSKIEAIRLYFLFYLDAIIIIIGRQPAFVLASRLLSRCPSHLRSPRLWTAQYTVTGPEFFIIAMGKIPGNRLMFQVGHVTLSMQWGEGRASPP